MAEQIVKDYKTPVAVSIGILPRPSGLAGAGLPECKTQAAARAETLQSEPSESKS